MEEADEILFDKYLDRELTAEERSAFEERLLNDEPFNGAFQLHAAARRGIKQQGRSELRTQLTGIGATIIPTINTGHYKPSLNHGNNIFKWLRRLFSIGLVVAGASLFVIYRHEIKMQVMQKIEVKPVTDSTRVDGAIHKSKPHYHIERKVIRRDTVYYRSAERPGK